MSRLTARDIATVVVFIVGAGAVVAFALLVGSDWALAAIGVLVGLVGIVSRIQFASRRSGLNHQAATSRDVRRASEKAVSATRGLAKALATTRREVADAARIAKDNIAEVRSDSEEASQRVMEQLAAVKQEVASVRSTVDGVEGLWRRIEPELITDVQALMQLIARYGPEAPLPLIAGWALSPAGLMYLTDAIERRQAEFVVECGSGTSTLWMAMAMRRNGRGKVLALEHLEKYAERTRALLASHGVADWAEVRVCSLVEVHTPRGEYKWYDLDIESLPQEIDILLVDGPPGSTGRHARYPALPRLGPLLADRSLVIVDDTDRPDEREVLRQWAEEWPEFSAVAVAGRGIDVLERGGFREVPGQAGR